MSAERKNTARVINAICQGRSAKPSRSIWTDGVSVFSYDTCIYTPTEIGRIINVTRYSATTSAHQSALRKAFPDSIQVQNVPKGATEKDLRLLA